MLPNDTSKIEEYKAKISKANSGREVSVEVRQRLSLYRKQLPNISELTAKADDLTTGFFCVKSWYDGPYWHIRIYRLDIVYSWYGLPYIFQPKDGE